MIKGVNRSIIEVLETGSTYYERALLVIKPEYASAQRDVLEKEAKKILSEMGAPSSLKHKGSRLKLIVSLATSAILGAAVTSLCFLIF